MTDRPTPRMTSRRPYLLRALYAWILDNGMTPHVMVDAGRKDVHVPPSAIRDGKVVLNISPSAVGGFEMDDDRISFNARFGGVSYPVWIPVAAVLAIYAHETAEGMMLPEDPYEIAPERSDAAASDDASAAQKPDRDMSSESTNGDSDENTGDGGESDGDGGVSPPPSRRGGHLRIVK